jgi:hypothetical protein
MKKGELNMGAQRANETGRIELLERDVLIQFNEIRELRATIEALQLENMNLAKQVTKYKQQDEDENGSAEEIGFYIKNQRLALGLSYNQLGRLLGYSGATINNYANGKGNLYKARAFAEKLREFRKSYGKKRMASTIKS